MESKTCTNVIVNTNFTAVHHWPDCPFEEVNFLKVPHRHVFHVTAKKEVNHDDRDVEFIMLKNQIDSHLAIWDNQYIGHQSCEMIARELLEVFNLNYVRVMEDGENGAEIFKTKI